MKTDTFLASSGEFEDFILQLHRVSSLLLDLTAFNKHGIGLAEWAILRTLGPEPLRIMQISRQARISRQRTTHLIGRLEGKGFVQFVDTHAGGRRRGIIASPLALTTLSAISRELKQIDLPGSRPLMPRLNKLLARLARSIRGLRQPGDGSLSGAPAAAENPGKATSLSSREFR